METQVRGRTSIQMYSLQKIADIVRISFELPGDPYSDDPSISKPGIEYLKSLGVFFYRDEMHQNGVIIEPDDDDPLPMVARHNFPAFYYQGNLDSDTLKIQVWNVVTDEVVKKKGDDRSWIKWGEHKNVLEFDQFFLRCS